MMRFGIKKPVVTEENVIDRIPTKWEIAEGVKRYDIMVAKNRLDMPKLIKARHAIDSLRRAQGGY